ncbi:ABC transporter ATP-binding protein [Paenibacillus sp. YYML68]|uniref:ABC transporter ATP-binding protein n=1 Tax=Paenibacillus sp. YYML68 TaxID=2909250 RepID=UPI00249328F0|nr:ABC transporter ATP-binding protein [Paenibacillus sp. YYML68]
MELNIQHVSKNYGAKQALRDVHVTLNEGILGLLGPNGAGKSTLMRILSTIEQPTSGAVSWNGVDIGKHPDELRRQLGYLPQDFGVYPNMTPIEFLEYMAAMKGISSRSARKRIDELLDILNLTEHRKRMLGGFSGGMKQRVGIAQSLLNDPSLLIVDEPTVGLDPEERIRFRNLLSTLASDRIVILSTHIVTDIESIAPHIAILSRGELVTYTTPEKLIQSVDHHVWHCVIPANQYQELQEKYTVSSAIHRQDGVHARIVSKSRPASNAVPLPPSLEDAYLFSVSRLGVLT